MRRSHYFFLVTFFLLINTGIIQAQSLYDPGAIQKIEVWFSQPNWDYQMDTAKHGAEGYLMADWVKINGVQYDSAGVKYKGNSSYDSTKLKNPIHIALDEFKDQSHQGYKDIKLSNGYGDPSHLREVLSYGILKNYMHCPQANFAQLYINGNYIGIYSSAENIDKKFCGDHFYSNSGTFVKCNPIVNPSPATKSNLKYITADSSAYSNYYEIKSKSGWNELVKLCDSSSNYQASIGSFTDLDRVIWMLAFNNLLVNLDSYSGVFSQNYYVYRDATQHYNPIIWDLNMCLGGFPFAGAGTSSMGTLTLANMQQFPISNHLSDPNWPLINAVLTNPSYKKMMVAHMRTMLNEQFVSNQYKTLTSQWMNLIDTAVQSDANSFFTHTQFLNSTNTDYSVGSYSVPGIYNLMDNRVSYLLSTPEFSAVAPTISNVSASNNSPAFNTTVNITATITNAIPASVTLGYRFNKTLKFTKAPMYDDGAHNDGAANDNVYGASVTMSNAQMQYYVYAENTDAASFSPERAEHEFYVLTATSALPNPGDLVINELLADNVSNEKDEYSDREDWIELYNKTNQVLDLSNVYLATKYSNLLKWKFPANTFINPNGYLTVWADDDSLQQILHTNFQLNKSADTLYLSKSNGTLLDSVSFGTQLSDVSFGRYPNGTGPFVAMNTTYGSENTNFPLSVSVLPGAADWIIYPNPAGEKVSVRFSGRQQVQVSTMNGRLIYSLKGKGAVEFSIANLAQGIYLVRCGHESRRLSVIH